MKPIENRTAFAPNSQPQKAKKQETTQQRSKKQEERYQPRVD
ncbi:hypothetical protein [Raineya orbicola]|jgi:hypothetical protein|uniref:Uncharacterized protein n=1 Tax=Raineya orbicola TaxID=2016530 RepID=A0A2N3IC05_9BACT|nr:hypothetical protein [Raineya orbicola]PKQ67805.1 hypothetical protein Rain11_1895 [Raineya orbicola]